MSEVERFFIENPIFIFEELFNKFKKKNTEFTVRTKIKYYRNTKRIGIIKGGLYYTIPIGSNPEKYIVDKFLLASKLGEDSIIGYHSAFELLGFANAIFNTVYYISSRYKRPLKFQDVMYKSILLPKPLDSNFKKNIGITKLERGGVKIKITDKERTLVDCIDNLKYAGGFEELIKCIESLPYLDLHLVFKYLTALDKKSLFAKIGFILERYKDKFFFDEKWIKKFHSKKPETIIFFDGRDKECSFNKRWNLMIPKRYLNLRSEF